VSKTERIYEFHRRVCGGLFPNARDIVEQFEVSSATAHRDIDYLRDRLLAPLAFDRKRNGYYYEEDGFRLPFEETPRIVFFLAMLEKMAEEAGLAGLPEVERLRNGLGRLLMKDHGRLLDRIYCEWVEVDAVAPEVMDTLLVGLLEDRGVCITYQDPKGRRTERVIEPLKLVNYQGRWYILAFCRLRRAMRLFHTARMTGVRLLDQRFSPDLSQCDRYLEESFGIFKGEPRHWAQIAFTGEAARVVRCQRWHRRQEMEETEDGVVLTVPVADFTELIMKVLQFGSRARVITPPELREAMAREIQAMAALYGGE